MYFIEAEQKELSVCLGSCGVVLRAGLDGQWKGATRGNMYFGFAVSTGLHHLCSSWQGHGLSQSQRIRLSSVTAEPRKTYYFEAHIDAGSAETGPVYTFSRIDADEANRLLAAFKVSDFHQKR